MQIAKGASRTVFLVGKYAIKFPSFDSWLLFLYGLIGNMHEKEWSDKIDGFLCPVIFSAPGGFMNIMPRCELESGLYERFKNEYEKADQETRRVLGWIVEDKDESVGLLNGKIVAIDYGS
jgi:hypothetical protein